jgi:hypothetical protein
MGDIVFEIDVVGTKLGVLKEDIEYSKDADLSELYEIDGSVVYELETLELLDA